MKNGPPGAAGVVSATLSESRKAQKLKIFIFTQALPCMHKYYTLSIIHLFTHCNTLNKQLELMNTHKTFTKSAHLHIVYFIFDVFCSLHIVHTSSVHKVYSILYIVYYSIHIFCTLYFIYHASYCVLYTVYISYSILYIYSILYNLQIKYCSIYILRINKTE